MITIQTTGLEQYAPGGQACVQVMAIGGPGAGKTRWSSFFPAPLYADCEGGLASIADRQMPFVRIRSTKDMKEFIDHVEQEARKPSRSRKYETVVLDTLDSYQRIVKDEWLRNHPTANSFSGYDAWGFLDAQMQLVMTRLLNLDMNVVVLVHYKDKTYTEGQGDAKTERHEFVLQLQGAMQDQAFNDFDLVGWMGTFWELDEEGQRVQKRGLTFKPTPDKPFLKDRLNVTPTFLEVAFVEQDYWKLFEAILGRIDELPASTVVGEVGEPLGEVVTPGEVGGPVDPRDPAEEDLNDLKKPQLVKLAQNMKIPFPGNILKAELVALIDKARQASVADAAPEPGAGDRPDEGAENGPVTAAPEAEAPAPEAAAEVVQREAVDTEQAPPPVLEEAAETITEVLGATEVEPDAVEGEEVVDLTPEAQAPPETETEPSAPAPAEPKPSTPGDGPVCAECGADVSKDSFAQLSMIKFKRPLCEQDYRAARSA